jgi:hypothetical protein
MFRLDNGHHNEIVDINSILKGFSNLHLKRLQAVFSDDVLGQGKIGFLCLLGLSY